MNMKALVWEGQRYLGEVDIPNTIINGILLKIGRGDLFNDDIDIVTGNLSPEAYISTTGTLVIHATLLEQKYPDYFDDMMVQLVSAKL